MGGVQPVGAGAWDGGWCRREAQSLAGPSLSRPGQATAFQVEGFPQHSLWGGTVIPSREAGAARRGRRPLVAADPSCVSVRQGQALPGSLCPGFRVGWHCHSWAYACAHCSHVPGTMLSASAWTSWHLMG